MPDLHLHFASALAGDLADLDDGHFDMQVDAIDQRAKDAAQEVLDLTRRAARFPQHLTTISPSRMPFALSHSIPVASLSTGRVADCEKNLI